MKFEFRFARRLAVLFAVLPAVSAFAAGGSAAPAKKGRNDTVELRVLPIGDTPVLRMKAADGAYRQQAYRAGEIPPMVVTAGDAKEGATLVMTINRVARASKPVRRAGMLPLGVPASEGVAASSWCELPLPDKCTRALALISAGEKRSWLNPVVRVLDISPSKYREAGVEVHNAARHALVFLVGAQRFQLRPGESKFLPSSTMTDAYPRFAVGARIAAADTLEIDATIGRPTDAVRFAVIHDTRDIPGRHIGSVEFEEPLVNPGATATPGS